MEVDYIFVLWILAIPPSLTTPIQRLKTDLDRSHAQYWKTLAKLAGNNGIQHSALRCEVKDAKWLAHPKIDYHNDGVQNHAKILAGEVYISAKKIDSVQPTGPLKNHFKSRLSHKLRYFDGERKFLLPLLEQWLTPGTWQVHYEYMLNGMPKQKGKRLGISCVRDTVLGSPSPADPVGRSSSSALIRKFLGLSKKRSPVAVLFPNAPKLKADDGWGWGKSRNKRRSIRSAETPKHKFPKTARPRPGIRRKRLMHYYRSFGN